jgi:ActR/RegA family two-component response regulator
MTDKLFVFLVTADEAFIARHKDRLAREFDLNVHRSAAECRAAMALRRPDFLILDLGLPERTGIGLQRDLRDDFDTSDLFQLHLCSEADAASDEVTADDLLLQPVSDAVFWRKLDHLRKVFAHNTAAREQMSYAQGVALTAMSAMGELGVVMQFLAKSFTCHNIQSVALLALESLRQYELEGVVHIVWEGDGLALTSTGEAPSDEMRTLIAQRRTLGRILEIERKLIVNFDHVSVLVTNLPEDDSQRRGRIRDNIATLAEGIESRIHGLLLEHDNVLKQQGIRYAVWEIRDSVKNLDTRQMTDLTNSRELVSRVIDDFEDAFLHMGMMPELENQLIGQLVGLRHKVAEIVGRPGEVHEKLQTVICALETLAGEVGQPG